MFTFFDQNFPGLIRHTYRVCISGMHIGHAYWVCILGMHIGHTKCISPSVGTFFWTPCITNTGCISRKTLRQIQVTLFQYFHLKKSLQTITYKVIRLGLFKKWLPTPYQIPCLTLLVKYFNTRTPKMSNPSKPELQHTGG